MPSTYMCERSVLWLLLCEEREARSVKLRESVSTIESEYEGLMCGVWRGDVAWKEWVMQEEERVRHQERFPNEENTFICSPQTIPGQVYGQETVSIGLPDEIEDGDNSSSRGEYGYYLPWSSLQRLHKYHHLLY